MFYDAGGTPNPNGHYELKDGKLSRRSSMVLQHGQQVHFDVTMRDAASAHRVFLHDSSNTSAQSVRDAAFGKVRLSDAQKAAIDARAAGEIAALESDPSRAWQKDASVQTAKAMRDSALSARYR